MLCPPPVLFASHVPFNVVRSCRFAAEIMLNKQIPGLTNVNSVPKITISVSFTLTRFRIQISCCYDLSERNNNGMELKSRYWPVCTARRVRGPYECFLGRRKFWIMTWHRGSIAIPWTKMTSQSPGQKFEVGKDAFRILTIRRRCQTVAVRDGQSSHRWCRSGVCY